MRAELQEHTSIDSEAWDRLVAASPQGSVFVQSWYLSAILPRWQGIVVYDRKGEMNAVMPLNLAKKYTIPYALQPVLAKYWGPVFAAKSFRNSYEEYSWKNKVMAALTAKIPPAARLLYYCHPAFDYGLPLAQQGYRLGARYTYRLRLAGNDLKEGFAESARRKISKASREGMYAVRETSPANLLQLLRANATTGKAIMDDAYFPAIERIAEAGYARGQAFTFTVKTADGAVAASSLMLNDHRCTYFFSGGILNPQFRHTGAVPYMVLHILEEAARRTPEFDFLGSMTESIERFFRSFGARPVPYLTFGKNKIPFLSFT